MAQNWNNILIYVKANLGSKLNNIEITDSEFVTYFKEQTLPELSQIEPAKAWCILKSTDLKSNLHKGGYLYTFELEDAATIVDVSELYIGDLVSEISGFGSFFFDPTDVVMSNTLNDMLQFLRTVNTFKFIRPNKLLLSEKINYNRIIIEVNVEHQEPNTVPSDLYHALFKKMCLADSIQLILANRMKYSNLTSPFGEINLNVDYLQNKLEALRQEITEINDWLPHRELIHVI